MNWFLLSVIYISKEPLVLVGFVIMLFVGLIKALINKDIIRISKAASERLINRGLLYTFIIAIVVAVCGFGLSFIKLSKDGTEKPDSIVQQTEGAQSPAVVTKGKNADVKIQYGEPAKDQSSNLPDDEKKKSSTGPDSPQSSSSHIEQRTEGKQRTILKIKKSSLNNREITGGLLKRAECSWELGSPIHASSLS